MSNTICFFSTKPYDQESFSLINKEFDHALTFVPERLSTSNVNQAQGCDAICVFVNDPIDAPMMEQLHDHGIKLIVLRCAGFNNVDLKAAEQYGIAVLRVPAYSPYAVAEFAMTLILGLNRKIHLASARTKSYNFSLAGLTGFDLHGKTIGIIGTGRIGLILAQICKGFGMNILAYDLYPNHEQETNIGFEYVSLETLYRQSDIISLHCPLSPETTHMISTDSIAQMKPGVMIINTGRGKLIDTKALIAGIKEGKIGSAGLDVYENEQEFFFEDKSVTGINDPVLKELLSLEQVIVSSHQAFFTHEALDNIAKVTLTNVSNFFAGNDTSGSVCK